MESISTGKSSEGEFESFVSTRRLSFQGVRWQGEDSNELQKPLSKPKATSKIVKWQISTKNNLSMESSNDKSEWNPSTRRLSLQEGVSREKSSELSNLKKQNRRATMENISMSGINKGENRFDVSCLRDFYPSMVEALKRDNIKSDTFADPVDSRHGKNS